MKSSAIRKNLVASACAAFSLVLVLVLSGTGYAEDYYWIGGSGSWNDPSNWSPYGVPTSGDLWTVPPPYDNVYLLSSDSTSRTITLTAGLVSSMTIDATGMGTINLSLQSGAVISSDRWSDLGASINVGVNGTGTVDIQGGTLDPSYRGMSLGVNTGSTGMLNVTDGSMYMASAPLNVGVNGTGIVNMTGGHIGDGLGGGRLTVGGYAGTGTFNLSGGEVHFTNSRVGGGSGTGTFNQSGGIVTVTVRLEVASGGTYNLSDGTINAEIEGPHILAGGTFNQTGGIQNSGLNGPAIQGTYNLSGGSLNTGAWNGMSISQTGTLNYSGGEIKSMPRSQNPDMSHFPILTNSGSVNLSGTGTRTLDGDVINNGTFKTTHTNAVYNGTFTNNSAYISDPATQYFTDLVNNQTAYMVGQNLDKFYISGDFINYSTMNELWNTSHAYLSFLEGADNLHDLYLAGVDLGALMSGYSDNFSWGTVDLANEYLNLLDGNSIAGGALYLRELLGLDIADHLIKNITGMDGLNIYYMANLAGNEYLHGWDYDLVGGGHLFAVNAVPEAATIFLFGAGLVGVAALRRRFKK